MCLHKHLHLPLVLGAHKLPPTHQKCRLLVSHPRPRPRSPRAVPAPPPTPSPPPRRCVFTAAGAAPDKPAGVVAITFTDLRRRGKIAKMVLVDAVGRTRQILGTPGTTSNAR